jgi:hypothetical protein
MSAFKEVGGLGGRYSWIDGECCCSKDMYGKTQGREVNGVNHK